MFAYSSISQAGYVLVGVQAASSAGTSAALFYLFTYAFIIIGAFAVVQLIQGTGEARNDLGEIRGLGRRQPALALAMLVFLLALAGVPFTSGFLAKFYVVSAAVGKGQYPLAIIAMLAAAVAAFFYLRVALLMYSTTPAGVEEGTGDGPDAQPAPPSTAAPVPVGGAAPGAVPEAAGFASPVTVATDDGTLLAGLEPVPSLDGKTATDTLQPPEREKITIPVFVGITLAICVVFTIFAGVSSPVITFARDATTLF
jgi:NADH-quinone oxidoreductase subunit N